MTDEVEIVGNYRKSQERLQRALHTNTNTHTSILLDLHRTNITADTSIIAIMTIVLNWSRYQPNQNCLLYNYDFTEYN